MTSKTEGRGGDLQSFFDTLRTAVVEATAADAVAARAAGRIFDALDRPERRSGVSPNRLPVCDCLPEALKTAEAASPAVAAHAAALAALEPEFAWKQRAPIDGQADNFAAGHANAVIAGVDGLEKRSDLRIGVSLLGPDVRYPDHRHPPEEIYLVLSSGSWRQEQGEWHEPGLGGFVYNPPNILHAMRSGPAPLLATWCLWVGAA